MTDQTKAIIGVRNGWGGETPFGLACRDRRHHVYVIGKTGAGKTTLLRNLILQDIAAGRGVGLIDPHGDLADDLLDHIPPWRADDLVYFHPADIDHPIGLNLLESVPEEGRSLVASSVVSIFKSIWRDSWGPRLEYILYNAVAALLDCPNTSLLGLQRIFVDDVFRSRVVRQVKDPVVRSFWENEFARYDRRFLQEAIAPIQNKVGQLLASSTIRNILGQVRSTIDLRFMMDNRRILIANLSKGQLGEDKANLLGAVLVAKFQLAALGRADAPEESREDFYLYIDEFQNFTTDAFVSILSEARKYRLCLTLSHQYLTQLSQETSDAVLGNAGTLISFRIGNRDAQVLEREIAFSARHLCDLANHRICVKMLDRGDYGESFQATTLPPVPGLHGRREKLIRRSREKYGTPRAKIEEKLRRWRGG